MAIRPALPKSTSAVPNRVQRAMHHPHSQPMQSPGAVLDVNLNRHQDLSQTQCTVRVPNQPHHRLQCTAPDRNRYLRRHVHPRSPHRKPVHDRNPRLAASRRQSTTAQLQPPANQHHRVHHTAQPRQQQSINPNPSSLPKNSGQFKFQAVVAGTNLTVRQVCENLRENPEKMMLTEVFEVGYGWARGITVDGTDLRTLREVGWGQRREGTTGGVWVCVYFK
ncbi:MAG: hypothetical protein Q9159_004710 [Coniocarpon cinnabarinum]